MCRNCFSYSYVHYISHDNTPADRVKCVLRVLGELPSKRCTVSARQCVSTDEEHMCRGTAAAVSSLSVCCAKLVQPSLLDDNITLQRKNKTFA